MNINILVGKTLHSIAINDDDTEIKLTTTDNEVFKLYHKQECCECVTIEDICGNINDLIGVPILVAEAVSNELVASDEEDLYWGSRTWTFYKLDTRKGGVTIRWFGESNGCYSETVDFVKLL